MKRAAVCFALLTLLVSMPALTDSNVRFVSVDVYVDSAQPLAAWQFEFSARNGGMQVVGVENGDSEAYGDAPYYDREAVHQGRADRIVVADFSLHDKGALPTGRVRVTTLHLMLRGDAVAEFDTRLVIATSQQGNPIGAEISIEISAGREK